MICKNCGNYIPNDNQECPICGTNSPKAKVVKVKKRSETKICPECGYKNSYKEFYCKSCNCELYENNEQEIVIDRRKTVAKFILLFLILFIVVFVFAIVSEIKTIENSSKPNFNYSHSVNSISSKSNNEPSKSAGTATQKQNNNSSSLGEKNALKCAKEYLNYSSFSYKGLIEQLEYEGYTHAEAVYAVDNCGADWNEQAAKTAKQYLEYSSFSRSGLIEQLEFEGFTHSQAVYGVEQNGY